MGSKTASAKIKKHLAWLCCVTGLFNFYARFRHKNSAFVLMYHRVLEASEYDAFAPEPGMYVNRETFEMQVAFLKEHYRLLPLQELIDLNRSGKETAGCCAITFDDGWRDNFTNAFPVLEKYQAPATIFLATSFIGTDRLFWPEEISIYLKSFPSIGGELSAPPAIQTFHSRIQSFQSAEEEIYLHQAIQILKNFLPEEREQILNFYRDRVGHHQLPRQMLNWAEVAVMEQSGLITFGAHTAEHEILDKIPLAQAKLEIQKSYKEVSSRLNNSVSIFAYPNGNYNQEIMETLRQEGIDFAVTTQKGFFHQGTPLLEIPRIGIHEDVSSSLPLFQGRILIERL